MNQLARAQKEAFEAEAGTECYLRLDQPLGMVVNPNCQIGKIVSGSQADKLGIKAGCEIISAGDSPVNTLAELKIIIAKTKLLIEERKTRETPKSSSKEESEGEDETLHQDELLIEYIDPKRIAIARAKVATLKAESAQRKAKKLASESFQAKKHATLESERTAAICKR